ncbi:MscS Mechanosensitive ion channel [Methanocaldococcus vulcanius M7]|uniref:MscS Mechanosensitive ion channel n=1 Tax=Methanocaldococcus vulcanius (strain ATCC 700851 / DSM 12094 / M7) TaxID=579137 RepID=C9RF93_METVM|nr:mechanosensitive ion channel family protein [Methanocaldococcus vulcanius]ACX72245.1 MscS Mechanosensitive ion channel [Methanocaldococcus vulcanius M7]
MTIMQMISYVISNNSLTNYVLSIISILVSIIIGKYANALIERIADKLHEKSGIELDELLVRALSLPVAIAIILAGFYFGVNFLYLPLSLKTTTNEGILTAFILCIIVFLDRFFTELVERYLAHTISKKTKKDVDDQFVVLTKKLVRLIVWVIGLLLILSNLGYDIKTLLAGLGIGGLAVALASQNLVSNLIAGLIIITDKPFKIGNWITFSGGSGIVEDIGIRSTKIRSQDNSIIVVPNSKLIDDVIQNVPSKNKWRVITTIGITYSTPVEKIKKAEEIIKNILLNHPNVEEEPITVYFKEYGDWSLNIQVVYYVKNFKYDGYRRYINTVNEINLKIKEEFDKEGIEFAFPTYTVYLKFDNQ